MAAKIQGKRNGRERGTHPVLERDVSNDASFATVKPAYIEHWVNQTAAYHEQKPKTQTLLSGIHF